MIKIKRNYDEEQPAEILKMIRNKIEKNEDVCGGEEKNFFQRKATYLEKL